MPPRRTTDFTSALYLGLRHSSRLLKPWAALTTGKPAAVGEQPGAARIAAKFAALIGCESAVLVSSTHHAFGDLFQMLASDDTSIFTDSALYPVARWGVERAAAGKALWKPFAHHDAARLAANVRRWRRGGQTIVVTDGLCPDCGKPAPLADYLRVLGATEALVVIDDTQALGILGRSPDAGAPYGRGGGGVLAWSGIRAPNVVVAASLAKGFGVPVAVVAGSRPLIARFKRQSGSRVHCSPPPAASLHAAAHAFALNQRIGDALRGTLASRVAEFREGLRSRGLRASGGQFPIQTLNQTGDAGALRDALLGRGVRTLLRRTHRAQTAKVSFAINAAHSPCEIQHALDALADCLSPQLRSKTGILHAGD